jgi:peptidoglycan/xylan/chitin deacetylase (PgdA/CDA1 family)
MTNNLPKKESTAKRHLLPKVLFSLLFLLLAGSAALFGYAAFQQTRLLKETRAQLSDKTDALAQASDDTQALNEEILSLQSALADTSSYLSEDDLDSEEAVSVPSDSQDSESDETEEETGSASYQKEYTELYVSKSDKSSGRIVHLTFDDGPSQNTPKVLDILDEYGIKATFFVVYNDEEPYCDYYKEIVDRGHTLAIHTASHNYKQVYASVDAYLEDFYKIYSYVYEKTGVRPTLFRYPGGSTNCLSYSAGSAIMEEMDRRGFTYFDWNVSSGDGGNQATRSTIYDWVTTKALSLNESVVLMHDAAGKGETVAALPSVIEKLLAEGCTFAPLTSAVEPVQFTSVKKSKD